MFENLGNFFKRMVKTEQQKELGSKIAAKERLHLVLMQDRANVSADFLELMKQEIIDVIKKYIVVDEDAIDVRLTNNTNEDGTNGAPALYANIPIVNIKNDMMAEKIKQFEGVDFNKEMGIISNQPQAEEVSNENVPEENVEVQEKEKESEEKVEEKTSEDNSQSESTEENEEKEIFEEIDEEDDDDVTFDDLLKAAEEADRVAAQENKKLEDEENKNLDEKDDSTSKKGRKGKNTKKSTPKATDSNANE